MTASKKSSGETDPKTEPQADPQVISALVRQAIEEAGIATLIDKAIGDVDLVELVASKLEDGALEKIIEPKLPALVDACLNERDNRLAAAASEEAAAIEAEEKQRVAETVRADRAAEKRRLKAADDQQKLIAKARDRAKMSYDSLIKQIGASSVELFENGTSMSLRLGNGSSFHPTLELELEADDLELEAGRYLNKRVIDLAGDLPGFIASEAFIVVEGNGSTAIYGSPIETPLRIGDGTRASLAPGALAFRRMSELLTVADAS